MPPPTSPPTTNPQQLPLPPLTTLITPQQIHNLFHTNHPRAARWHLIFTQLHHAALHPDPNDATKQQRAHQKLASLSRIVETVRERKRAEKGAGKENEKETAAAAAALLQQLQQQQQQQSTSTSTVTDPSLQSQQGVQNAPEAGKSDFVRLDELPFERQACTMCKKLYSVPDVDGEVAFRNYPVRLSCSHLVCFGCAKVLLRMLVNCACCGASFGDGRVEMARIERQVRFVGGEVAKGACFEAGYGGSCCGAEVEAEEDESDATVSDGDGDGGEFTLEDVEGVLALLNLAGKRFGMEDVDAGLALLKLRAGRDVTLEDYLLTILRQ